MARNTFSIISLVPLGIVLVLLLVVNVGNASNTDENRALIIVSDYDGIDQNEIEKAIAYYEYLIDGGYSSSDVEFLCMSDIACKDGDSTLVNVENAFEDLVNECGKNTNVKIYVSDNTHCINSQIRYRFTDGVLPCLDVVDWIDDMSYCSLDYFTLGNHSGLFGAQAIGDDRIIISSMGWDEAFSEDQFDITRGYNDPSADINNDGVVSTEEAFESERVTLLLTDQTPIMW